MRNATALIAVFAVLAGCQVASPPGKTPAGAGAPGRRRGVVLKVLDKHTADVEWSPDGRRIAYCKRDTTDWHMDIWTVRPDGTGHRKLNAGWDRKPGFPHKNVGCATWHPTGRYLAFVAANNDVRGKRPETLSQPGSGVNCNLWFTRADGSRVARLTKYPTSYTAPRGVIHPQFSEDGRKLAWTELLGRYPRKRCFEWGEWGVVVADFVIRDGRARVENLRRFRPGRQKSFYEAHHFSADGRRLLLCGNTERGQPLNGIDILEMDVETGRFKRLTRTLTDWDEHAHYSPDGKKIAWASGAGMNVKFASLRCPDWMDYVKLDLWAMNADGSGRKRITFFNQPGHPDHEWFTKGIYNSPRMVVADNDWSPDGRKIVATVVFEGPEKKLGSLLLMLDAASRLVGGQGPRPVVGIDDCGKVHNQPEDWPADAGIWNGKGARYNPRTRQLVFEVFRKDIVGGSIWPAAGRIRATGITRVFIAGPETGSEDRCGTTVLYISDRDGRNARGIGCSDVCDGKAGCSIHLVKPSSTAEPNAPARLKGTTVYANQNKDLAAWHPNGKWVFAAVEMPRHALTHDVGNGEIGMFNNLWAISSNGRIWVQLTHFEKTWRLYDPVAMTPYASLDIRNCPGGPQYANRTNRHPYCAYFASARGEPPPAAGIMRATVGNLERGGRTPIVWAERVGLHPKYTWGGVLQLATAEIVFREGLPALTNYRRNLTPTPEHPGGTGLWSNPRGKKVIGAGYEPWAFSRDDARILFASDACLPFSGGDHRKSISPWSQAFTDVVSWRWKNRQALWNVTARHPRRYAYRPNGGPRATREYGHWEEPAVYLLSERRAGCVAFASSANLLPPWDPMKHRATFGLDVWLTRREVDSPARRLTFFNRHGGPRKLAYPTACDPRDDTLFVTVVPGGRGGANPPGTIYALQCNDRASDITSAPK